MNTANTADINTNIINDSTYVDFIEDTRSDNNEKTFTLDNKLNNIQKRAFDVIKSTLSEKHENKVSLDTNFNSISLDSITFIQTVVILENEFDFEFDDEKLLITEFPTVKTMIDYVESKVQP